MNSALTDVLFVRNVRKFGAVAVFCCRMLVQCVPALARPQLIVSQIYNAGARSLIIIMLSGLFIGMVIGVLTAWIRNKFLRKSAAAGH